MPILAVKDVKKHYVVGSETIKALNGVNLEIKRGDFTAIIGKSGSGKSTLMHIIGLLDTPTKGQVLLKGKDISKYTETELALARNKEIGFVFQSFNLLQRTSTLDNVELPLKYAKVKKKDRIKTATEMLQLVGLGDRLHNKSNELSGGQKQRVAIARALVNDPSIILADEPTGNLDTKTGDEIIKLFKKLNKMGKTIVIVTHDEDLAKIAKKRITISDGLVVK
ncbi:ABC transporter ATP-binding protein [bacterium]|nr:ABC transporter ATP-binding protein [bacterium]